MAHIENILAKKIRKIPMPNLLNLSVSDHSQKIRLVDLGGILFHRFGISSDTWP